MLLSPTQLRRKRSLQFKWGRYYIWLYWNPLYWKVIPRWYPGVAGQFWFLRFYRGEKAKGL